MRFVSWRALSISQRGFEMRLVTWRALSISPYLFPSQRFQLHFLLLLQALALLPPFPVL